MKLACLSHLRGKHGRSTARFFSFLRAKREGFKRVWCGVPSKLRHPQSHFNHQSHRHGRRQFHKRHTFDVFLLMRALAVIFGAIFSIKLYIYIYFWENKRPAKSFRQGRHHLDLLFTKTKMRGNKGLRHLPEDIVVFDSSSSLC